MEIMNSKRRKRTILAVSDKKNDLSELRQLLEPHYNIVAAVNENRDFTKTKELAGAISVAIVCAEDAAANDFELFRWLATDSMLAAIPLLIYCGSAGEFPAADECIRRGAVDIIMPPLDEGIVLHRIENKDSATFLEIERMLRELPSNIYLKDAEGRYIFATHYWHHLDHSDDPDWTIRGKTDIEIRKDRDNAIKAMESDKELLRTGKGTNYIIAEKADDMIDYLELIKRPVYDTEGNITGIIALINNVTEQELLKQSLEEKALKDELTGAGNRRSFDRFVETLQTCDELPISIISADCNSLKYINDTYGHLMGDEYLRMTVLLFRTVLPENSRIFRTGGDEFVIVLPNTDYSRAQQYIAEMLKEQEHLSIRDRRVSVACGAACIASHENSVREYIDLADKRMYEAKNAYKKHIALNR